MTPPLSAPPLSAPPAVRPVEICGFGAKSAGGTENADIDAVRRGPVLPRDSVLSGGGSGRPLELGAARRRRCGPADR
ncbi:hypothetical protein GCM10009625_09410 [Brachybacterium fresconis]